LVIYTWTPELKAAVEDAKAARLVHIAPFLFCDRKGQSYLDEETGQCHGWKSMWQRFIDQALPGQHGDTGDQPVQSAQRLRAIFLQAAKFRVAVISISSGGTVRRGRIRSSDIRPCLSAPPPSA
jgi:hypothetical protein